MKVKSEITVLRKSGQVKLNFNGKERVTSCMGFSVLKRAPSDICVGDYVEHDGVLCRVIKSNSEEYDEKELWKKAALSRLSREGHDSMAQNLQSKSPKEVAEEFVAYGYGTCWDPVLQLLNCFDLKHES